VDGGLKIRQLGPQTSLVKLDNKKLKAEPSQSLRRFTIEIKVLRRIQTVTAPHKQKAHHLRQQE